MKNAMLALGLMSGTSMDGIDAAIIETNGEEVNRLSHGLTIPYSDAFKARLARAIRKENEDLAALEKDLTTLHAEAVEELLKQSGIKKVDIIGFHGHTIEHRPDQGFTKQIGDGALLAKLTGTDVIYDFRSNDVKNGGQGAPLVPLYHAAIMRQQKKPVAVLNIGGVANVTYIGGGSAMDILAFDTGPGNALINDWIFQHTGKHFDEGGKIAATGSLNHEVVDAYLSDKYFDAPPPKSLDRNTFSLDAVKGLSLEEGAATLTRFTVDAVALASSWFAGEAKSWFVCGGGRHNVFMMQQLSDVLNAKVLPIDSLGINGDYLEAEAFAYLAVRSKNDMFLTLTTTTGVCSSATGGVYCAS